MLTGRQLIQDIDQVDLPPGQLAFWWLGQHSFVVKLGKQVLYFDPFFSNILNRTIPSLLTSQEIGHAHYIFGSHDHADHIDRPAWPDIAQAAPQSQFIVPEHALARGLASDLNIEKTRFVGINAEQTITLGDLRITAIAAWHERLNADPVTGHLPFLGYLVQGHGCCIYHAGDTIKYEGLETRLKQAPPITVAFLPINGRDGPRARRGLAGNMNFLEAADLAAAIKPQITVPTHFEMFLGNTADPYDFIDYAAIRHPHIQTFVPRHGHRYLAITP